MAWCRRRIARSFTVDLEKKMRNYWKHEPSSRTIALIDPTRPPLAHTRCICVTNGQVSTSGIIEERSKASEKSDWFSNAWNIKLRLRYTTEGIRLDKNIKCYCHVSARIVNNSGRDSLLVSANVRSASFSVRPLVSRPSSGSPRLPNDYK